MLSAVIPTYQKPELLRQTLGALAGQVRELGDDCDVVVVDDGSDGDATKRVLEEFASRMPLVDASAPVNEGRARARNRGWRAARGEWILFLDDDIRLRPGALRAHRDAQRQEGAVWMGPVVTAPEIVDAILFDYLDSRGIAKLAPGQEAPARYLLTQNVSVPRSALERVGGFDEEFGSYGFEDMELAFRLAADPDLRFHRLDGAVGDHVHHHTLAEYLEKKRACGESSLPRLAALHPDRIAEMRLDLLPGIGGDSGLARALELSWRARLQVPLEALLARWPRHVLPAVAFLCLDYLVLSAYRDGLRRRLP